ncbi:MAG: hypothetical protein AAEJ57_00680 [Opitutales bacterium]
MKDITDFDAPTRPAWIGALIPVVLVLGAAGLYWWLTAGNNAGPNGENLPSSATATSGKLVSGQTYYLFASEIELYPSDPEGKAWDGGDDGPDIRYRMLWQGNEVFNSEVVGDSLIAHWSGLALKLKWSDLLGKTISPENAIKAALVSAEKGGSVVMEVEDVDVTADDEAGRLVISFDELQVGKKEFSYPKSLDNSVRRVVIRALPVNSSARDLFNLMK